MKRKEFYEKMLKLAKIYMPEWILSKGELKLRKQEKLNDTILWGIMIEPEDGNVTPIVYLEEFYDEYKKGKSMIEIVTQFVYVYEKAWNEIPVPQKMNFKFENIKNLIIFKIVNAHRNTEMLKNMAYKMINDEFAMICSVQVMENACININKKFMKEFEIDTEEMYIAALENTPKIFPVLFKRMDQIFGEEYIPKEVSSGKLYLLSNEKKYCGASVIFYPGVMENISKKMNGDFYAIPSSIHEWIVFKGEDVREIICMEDTIAYANENCCHITEVLGEHLYKYDSVNKSFEIWKTP